MFPSIDYGADAARARWEAQRTPACERCGEPGPSPFAHETPVELGVPLCTPCLDRFRAWEQANPTRDYDDWWEVDAHAEYAEAGHMLVVAVLAAAAIVLFVLGLWLGAFVAPPLSGGTGWAILLCVLAGYLLSLACRVGVAR